MYEVTFLFITIIMEINNINSVGVYILYQLFFFKLNFCYSLTSK
jgi:hypothetical protein